MSNFKIYNEDFNSTLERLIRNDSEDFLGRILGRPDCIITSPPFHPEDLNMSATPSKDIEDLYMEWYFRLIHVLTSTAKDYVIVFNSPTRRKSIYRTTNPLDEITWIRSPSMYKYKTQPIFIYQGTDPSFNFRNPMWSDVLWHYDGRDAGGIGLMVEPVAKGEDRKFAIHPYQDPVDIYKFLLRMQLAGNPNTNFVYDPFCGTGTSGVAALKLGLRYVASEINLTWATLATERLTRTLTDDQHATEAWT